jgi:Ni/Co efflux regulator RcnB
MKVLLTLAFFSFVLTSLSFGQATNKSQGTAKVDESYVEELKVRKNDLEKQEKGIQRQNQEEKKAEIRQKNREGEPFGEEHNPENPIWGKEKEKQKGEE